VLFLSPLPDFARFLKVSDYYSALSDRSFPASEIQEGDLLFPLPSVFFLKHCRSDTFSGIFSISHAEGFDPPNHSNPHLSRSFLSLRPLLIEVLSRIPPLFVFFRSRLRKMFYPSPHSLFRSPCSFIAAKGLVFRFSSVTFFVLSPFCRSTI